MTDQIPKNTRSYYFPTLGSYTNLTLQTTDIPSIKATHVLVKVHAVSLQYRDLIIASNNYPATIEPDNLVPCSDMGGEVVAIGSDVTRWNVGDRVCANFCTDHLDGDIDADIFNTALSAGQQGVLTEYRAFNDYVLIFPAVILLVLIILVFSHWSKYRIIYPMKRLQHCLVRVSRPTMHSWVQDLSEQVIAFSSLEPGAYPCEFIPRHVVHFLNIFLFGEI